jgi:23S rRNA (cytidine1920-2'-O)/16S rRNA (cytidine1409-2'-O)-methyltransferase
MGRHAAIVTPTGRVRLDSLLVARGLVESRARARAMILAGKVEVVGVPAAKAGSLVSPDADVRVVTPEHPWVSRGGIKLAHALDRFAIDVAGRRGLDIGASTGGFTDVLLQRGAAHVVALDVGHGQIHWKLRSDPRVSVVEGLNARHLTATDVPELASGVGIVTIDVSFISLRHILPAVPSLLLPGADVIALVKPQFEAGRAEVGKGGLVTDPAVHDRVVADVTSAAAKVGLAAVSAIESPITGSEGNREFLLHLRSLDAARGRPERVEGRQGANPDSSR